MADETTRIETTKESGDETIAIPVRSTPGPNPPPDTRTIVEPLVWLGWPLGGAMVVWAMVALARIGFEGYDPYLATTVAGLGVSRLLAVIVLFLGLFIWAGVAGAETNVRGLRTLGAVGIVFGLVLLIEPEPFEPYLGSNDSFGLVTASIGAVLVGVSLIRPFPFGSRPTN